MISEKQEVDEMPNPDSRKIITIPQKQFTKANPAYRNLHGESIDIDASCKIITTPESRITSTYIPRTKRIITESKKKWAFFPEELASPAQRGYIHDICGGAANTQNLCTLRVKQQIVQKIHGYRSQDIRNGIFSADEFIDLWCVLKKLHKCELTCFYCKDPVFVLYENVREPTQWTVERIDNTRGHNRDNFEIACLACNLHRRTIHYERYLMTKRLCNISKGQ